MSNNNINIVEQSLNTLWIDKYRPKDINDFVLNNDILIRIKKFIENKTMPNIILTGCPGVGKTSTILYIAKKLLGRYFNEGVLELNASDERGVKVVHDIIHFFCKKQLQFNHPDKYANHKIVLLDEADNMTQKAQQSINILMETYKNTTRFAFTCNSSSQILESIQSKCIIIRYEKLSNEDVSNKLKTICKLENVQYDDNGIDSISLISQGDLRHAINNLQLIYNSYKNITSENVLKLCDKPDPVILKKILLSCKNKDIIPTFTYLNELIKKGYSSSDIVVGIINLLKTTNMINELSEKDKINFLMEFSKTNIIISKGLNTNTQLTGCICSLILIN